MRSCKSFIFLFLAILGIVFLIVPVAKAVPVPPGTKILVVDGTTELNGVANTTVTPTIVNPLIGYDFGQVVAGVFSPIISDVTTIPGGTLVDFAIREQSPAATVFSLTNSAPASVIANLSGPNLSGNEEIPNPVAAYYNTLDFQWLLGGNLISLQVLNAGTNTDGFAAVPIPTSALLFGSGLIGLIGIARRNLFVK